MFPEHRTALYGINFCRTGSAYLQTTDLRLAYVRTDQARRIGPSLRGDKHDQESRYPPNKFHTAAPHASRSGCAERHCPGARLAVASAWNACFRSAVNFDPSIPEFVKQNFAVAILKSS